MFDCQMKKIGKFKKNMFLIKYHNITFQCGLSANAFLQELKINQQEFHLRFLTRIFLLTNILLLKAYILNKVGSKQLNNKLKTKQKISLKTRQAVAATPTTPAIEENNEDLLEKIRKIVREELEHHQEKVSEIIKSQLTNTNECLDKISQKVVDITKSLKFTQEELHDSLANMKNDI